MNFTEPSTIYLQILHIREYAWLENQQLPAVMTGSTLPSRSVVRSGSSPDWSQVLQEQVREGQETFWIRKRASFKFKLNVKVWNIDKWNWHLHIFGGLRHNTVNLGKKTGMRTWRSKSWSRRSCPRSRPRSSRSGPNPFRVETKPRHSKPESRPVRSIAMEGSDLGRQSHEQSLVAHHRKEKVIRIKLFWSKQKQNETCSSVFATLQTRKSARRVGRDQNQGVENYLETEAISQLTGGETQQKEYKYSPYITSRDHSISFMSSQGRRNCHTSQATRANLRKNKV